MGFFDRIKKKKTNATVAEEQSTPAVTHKIYVNLPSYFKAGDGEYHLFVDGVENVCKPFSKLDLEVTEGVHSFRVFSTPETLADVTQELEIKEEVGISVTVNVKDRTLNVNLNDKLRSSKEFREKFKADNHIKDQ